MSDAIMPIVDAEADPPIASLGAAHAPDHSLRGLTKIGPIRVTSTGLYGVSNHGVRGYPNWLTPPTASSAWFQPPTTIGA